MLAFPHKQVESISLDGDFLYVSVSEITGEAWTGSLHLFNLATNETVLVYQDYPCSIVKCSGEYVYAAKDSGRVYMFSKELVGVKEKIAHTGLITGMDVKGDVVTCDKDEQFIYRVALWGKDLMPWTQTQMANVEVVKFIENDKIAAGTLGGEIWILDGKRLSVVCMAGVLDSKCVEILNAGEQLICIAESGQVLTFDQSTNYTLTETQQFNSLLSSAFYNNGLYLGTQTGELIYNSTSHKIHQDAITSIAVLSDGSILTSSLDGNIQKTQIQHLKQLVRL